MGLPRSGCLSRQAKPPKLSLVAGRATAAMGGRRSRPPALGMTQRWMKSCGGWMDVPSCRPPRLGAAVRRRSRIPRRKGPLC